MSLQPGTQVGPYEVVNLLGAGGMGEVYRARDPRLGRDVAIKVLRAAAHTPERIERFTREARAAAAISHPNLLTVLDVGNDHESPFIVSELLHGETLRDALVPGTAWPPRRVHDVGVQIAAGLAAAHAHGIVHRDLKPENVFLCDDGTVKILDFGLARLTQRDEAPADGITSPLTGDGIVLGTIGYMAPEQACGQTADHRADLFAFGAILYELMSGRRAFTADSAAETLRAILTTDPPDLTTRGDVPAGLARLVARCLEKRPERRFQSASDLGFALETLSTGSSASGAVAPAVGQTRKTWPWVPAIGALVAVVALAWAVAARRAVPTLSEAEATVVDIDVPRGPDILYARFAPLSHDGRRLIVIVDERAGVRLWIRTLDTGEHRRLPETEGAHEPVFWSADDQQLAFGADGWLKKVDLGSGAVERVCPLPRCGWVPGAGTWGSQGDILVECRGLYHVRSTGGVPSLVAAPDLTRGEYNFDAPQFLPDGRQYLFTGLRSDDEHANVYLGVLGSTERRVLVRADSSAAYAAPGYLLFARGGTLVAQAFDPGRGHLEGQARRIVSGLTPTSWATTRGIWPSQRGHLLVLRGQPTWQFAWYDRQGRELSRLGDPVAELSSWDLSPDGTSVAMTVMIPGRNAIRHVDLASGRKVRLSQNDEDAADPRFSADGRMILFASTARDKRGLRKLSVESGARTSVFQPQPGDTAPATLLNFHDWSRDGQLALYDPSERRGELWSVRLENGAARLVVRTEGLIDQARFSPDGQRIAFNEFRAGRPDVYVVPLPPTGERWQVSTQGGMQPAWRGDGRELFYLDPRANLLAVDVIAGKSFQVGAPRLIVNIGELFGWSSFEDYAVTADGQRFLVRVRAAGSLSPAPTLILNWPALLRQ